MCIILLKMDGYQVRNKNGGKMYSFDTGFYLQEQIRIALY